MLFRAADEPKLQNINIHGDALEKTSLLLKQIFISESTLRRTGVLFHSPHLITSVDI
jgi:hypothetical protein